MSCTHQTGTVISITHRFGENRNYLRDLVITCNECSCSISLRNLRVFYRTELLLGSEINIPEAFQRVIL